MTDDEKALHQFAIAAAECATAMKRFSIAFVVLGMVMREAVDALRAEPTAAKEIAESAVLRARRVAEQPK